MAQERQLKLLDELRARHVVAQARFQVAQQIISRRSRRCNLLRPAFQKAQQELMQAQQEFHGWNVAVAVVEREEASADRQQTKNNLIFPL